LYEHKYCVFSWPKEYLDIVMRNEYSSPHKGIFEYRDEENPHTLHFPLLGFLLYSSCVIWVLLLQGGGHRVMDPAQPALTASGPLPNKAIILLGLSVPATASRCAWAIPLILTQISLLTCLSFSFMVMDDLTCRNDMPDLRRVMSMSLPLFVNQPLATFILPWL
jgi:hypothetical protein